MHVESRALTLPVVNSYQLDELLAAFDQARLGPLWLRVVLERECHELVNRLHPLESLYGNSESGLSKYLAVEVQIATFYTEIFPVLFAFALFAKVEFDTPRLPRSKAISVYDTVRLEDGPQEVECDLFGFQKCITVCQNRGVRGIEVVD